MNCRSVNINEHGNIYGAWQTAPGDWTICFGNVYCYLLVGESAALLIDTAYGEGNLRELVEEITDKPLYVANTHGHFDHTGGNGWWPEIYAAAEAKEIMRNAFSPEMQAAVDKMPHADYAVNEIGDGYIFDLGDRTVEVIAIGAHHASSVAFLDRERGSLYSGDELESGQVLLFVHGSSLSSRQIIEKHRANMLRLKQRQSGINRIFPAHNGCPIMPGYIDDYITLSDRLLSGTAELQPDLAGYGFPPDGGMFGEMMAGRLVRARYGLASFVFEELSGE